MTRYNPFIQALIAAWAVLISDEAKSYYHVRAQQDTQAVADAAVTAFALFYQAAVMAFQMGQMARNLYELVQASNAATKVDTVVDEPQIKLLAPATVAGLLPASVPPHPDQIRYIRQCQKVIVTTAYGLTTLQGDAVLITPAPAQAKPKPNRSRKPKAIAGGGPETTAGRRKPTTIRGV